jgi:hypothetical protein
MWTSTSVSRIGFDRWQIGLADARLVKEPLIYEDIVNDGPANAPQRDPYAVAQDATENTDVLNCDLHRCHRRES